MSEAEHNYRAELARTLRDADKSERGELLREAKRTDEYLYAHSRQDRVRDTLEYTQHMMDIVRESGSLSDIRSRLAGTMQHRFDDVLKALEIAERYNVPSIVPEEGGLRAFVANELSARGAPNESLTEAEYEEFLGKRIGRDLSEEEIRRIAEKVPLGVFLTLDTGIEKSVLLLNALSGTTTLFSCSGHVDGLESRGGSWTDTTSSYLFFNAGNTALIETLYDALVERTERYRVSLKPMDKRGQILSFRKVVPEEWIRAHGKKTEQEIFEECKIKLSETLGPKMLEITWKEGSDNDSRLFETMRTLQDEYLATNPASTNQPFGRNSRILSDLGEYVKDGYEWREYKEFYFSPESEGDRHQFLQRLEDTIDNYRRGQSAA